MRSGPLPTLNPQLSKSALDQAAVHLEGRAGNVARALAREKSDDFADLSRFSVAAEGDGLLPARRVFIKGDPFLLRTDLVQFDLPGRQDVTRHDGVDQDAFARELVGHSLREG